MTLRDQVAQALTDEVLNRTRSVHLFDQIGHERASIMAALGPVLDAAEQELTAAREHKCQSLSQYKRLVTQGAVDPERRRP